MSFKFHPETLVHQQQRKLWLLYHLVSAELSIHQSAPSLEQSDLTSKSQEVLIFLNPDTVVLLIIMDTL